MSKKLIFKEEDIFKKNPKIQDIKTEEGIIISPLNTKNECIYYLDNEVSFRIWELIDGKNPLGTIKESLVKEFNVDEDTLKKDLKNFIQDLYHKKIILKC